MVVGRLVGPALVSVLVAASLAAQSSGTVELKGFGQDMRMNGALNVNDGVGGGGGLGLFVSPRWEIEADAAWLNVNQGWFGYNTATARVVDNIPLDAHDRLLIGAGPGITNGGAASDFIVGGLVGWRHAFTPVVQSRIDGLVQYNANPAGGLVGSTSSKGIGYHTDVGVRVGLSLLLDWRKGAQAPPPAPAPVAAPSPAPVVAAPPAVVPPAPVVQQAPPPAPPPPAPAPAPPRVNTDSINRASAAAATLRASVHFAYDKSLLRPDDEAALQAKVPILKANPGVRIRIEGNCDERGSDEYNLALGMRRALAAKSYLVARGIDAGRIDVVSYGKERPTDAGHSESAWSQNRRDDFVIVVGAESLIGP